MMISYSNNLEDVILNRVFADVDRGFYVDVGSYKAFDHSNTAALYNRGWHGACCDPIYNFEHSWASEWKAFRPRDVLVRDLIGEHESGEAEFFISNYREMSSGDPGTIRSNRDRNGATVGEKGSKVTTTNLTRVLNYCLNGDTLHLVCIDVEGMEDKVLKGLDFGRYRPWVFVIESVYNYDMTPSYDKWENILSHEGYTSVYDDGVNRFYVHQDQSRLVSRFAYPPNSLDNYKLFRMWELERRLSEYESNNVKLEI